MHLMKNNCGSCLIYFEWKGLVHHVVDGPGGTNVVEGLSVHQQEQAVLHAYNRWLIISGFYNQIGLQMKQGYKNYRTNADFYHMFAREGAERKLFWFIRVAQFSV